MRNSTAWALAVLGTTFSNMSGQTPNLRVGVQVFDMATNPVARATARLSIPGVPERSLTETDNQLRAELERNSVCGQSTFNLLVDGPDVYSRHIPIFSTRPCKSGDYTYKVYLAPRPGGKVYNSAYVRQAKTILSRQGPDAAWAYLSPAMEEFESGQKSGAERSDYACLLKHYYATALHRSCVNESYDTCDRANQIYNELNGWQECQRVLRTEGSFYKLAQADVLGKEALVAVEQGNHTFAIQQFQAILEIQSTGVDLSPVGMTEDSLRTSLGMSYVRLGAAKEASSPADALKAWGAAKTELGLVERPSRQVLSTLDLVQDKITILGN